MRASNIRGKIKSYIVSFMHDQRGSMLALSAVSFTAVIGFAGMGVDMAMWYSEKRVTQSIADAAAVAATYAMQEGLSQTDVALAARTEAIRNGFVETAGNTLTVNNAAATATTSSAVARADITVTRQVPVFLAGAFLADTPSVSATATGGVLTLGNICVIGLDHDEGRTVQFTGNTLANIGCGVASNSSSGDALYVSGNATLIANPAQSFGDIVVAGSGELISQLPPMPFSPRVADPFAGRSFPVPSATCDFSGLVVDGDQTIGPALSNGSVRICGDLTVRPGAILTLESGIYFVDGGDVLFQGTVDGTSGATIVLTGATSADVGQIDIRAQSIVNLTAPTTGEYAGIVVHQDALAGQIGDNKFNGGASLTLVGAIYIKNQSLTYNGGSDVDGCTMIVARTVTFSGTSFLRNTLSLCASVSLDGTAAAAQEQVVLLQ